jgi:hypothetical protein
VQPTKNRTLKNQGIETDASLSEVTAADSSIAQARLESIKAGLFSALAVMVAAALVWLAIAAFHLPLPLPNSRLAWFVNSVIAVCSGFFFGITYRYVVRQDDNLHLGSGAVGAFAFVRSLAQIEALWDDSFAILTWLLITGESFLWFAIARYSLDWAIGRQKIKPLD